MPESLGVQCMQTFKRDYAIVISARTAVTKRIALASDPALGGVECDVASIRK
jgi:hypothetical protein